jgi:hypothetical protein
MGRSCYICGSPHRAEYDGMRLKGKPITEIYYHAKNTYNENHLRYHHFQKHFENHVELLVNEQTKSSKLRDEYVKRIIKTDMEVVERIHKNLTYIADKIDEKVENMENPIAEEMFLKFVAEARMIIEQYLKWGTKMHVADTSEDMEKKIMKCIADFPADLIAKFVERWEEYDRPSAKVN